MINLMYFLLACYLSIAIHEWGHYVTARFFSVKVPAFHVGMGPALFSRERKGTRFYFRLLPIGGAVETDDAVERKLVLWKRWVILSAGVALNFVLFILSLSMMTRRSPLVVMTFLPKVFEQLVAMIPSFWHWETLYSPAQDLPHQVAMVGDVASQTSFWMAMALMNFMLFLMNILPIPILDGGRMWMALLESISRKLGVSEAAFDKAVTPLYVGSWLFLLSPYLINNVWSLGVKYGMTLVESLLWFSLFFFLPLSLRLYRSRRKKVEEES